MLKINELHVGSLVYDICGKVIEFDLNNFVSTDEKIDLGFFNQQGLTPIPISIEWLLNFGFQIIPTKRRNYVGYVKNGIEFDASYLPDYLLFEFEKYMVTLPNKKIKFVHELQLFYLVVTGEDL